MLPRCRLADQPQLAAGSVWYLDPAQTLLQLIRKLETDGCSGVGLLALVAIEVALLQNRPVSRQIPTAEIEPSQRIR